MARTRKSTDEPSLWSTLEAEQLELESYVTARLGGSSEDAPIEPDWVRDARDAAWPSVLADAAAAAC